ncbi:MAG: hypothetical protein REI78_09395 [Pedobacter sp.]|nr:hypothetical protein [Pedobacter sp.]MDQ8053230.1 hypothetical protein [Pedobacter sp.]
MVEVFKTNVADVLQADYLIELIHANCPTYRANFDLEDCDRILRIVDGNGSVCASTIIALLEKHDFEVEVLEDIL